jgi:hypothetical protein
VSALQGHGVSVAARVPLEMPQNPFNRAYLRTKREKLGHALVAGSAEGRDGAGAAFAGRLDRMAQFGTPDQQRRAAAAAE